MREQLQERYLQILRDQASEGLDILERMTVADKKYQQVVVNINNANNIAFQLENEIEAQKEVAKRAQEEIAKQKEEARIASEKEVAKLNKESVKPKKTKTAGK